MQMLKIVSLILIISSSTYANFVGAVDQSTTPGGCPSQPEVTCCVCMYQEPVIKIKPTKQEEAFCKQNNTGEKCSANGCLWIDTFKSCMAIPKKRMCSTLNQTECGKEKNCVWTPDGVGKFGTCRSFVQNTCNNYLEEHTECDKRSNTAFKTHYGTYYVKNIPFGRENQATRNSCTTLIGLYDGHGGDNPISTAARWAKWFPNARSISWESRSCSGLHLGMKKRADKELLPAVQNSACLETMTVSGNQVWASSPETFTQLTALVNESEVKMKAPVCRPNQGYCAEDANIGWPFVCFDESTKRCELRTCKRRPSSRNNGAFYWERAVFNDCDSEGFLTFAGADLPPTIPQPIKPK